MSVFKKLAEKLGIVKEETVDENKPFLTGSDVNRTEEISEERKKLIDSMQTNLRKLGFDDNEVNEVIFILNKLDRDKQVIKDSLIGTNINNPNADQGLILKEALTEIRKLELQAASDVQNKIAEIRKRKSV